MPADMNAKNVRFEEDRRDDCYMPQEPSTSSSSGTTAHTSMEVGYVQVDGEVYINGLAVNQEAAEEDGNQGGELTDDFEMDPEMVEEGRREEREYMETIDMFEYSSEARVWEESGKAAITTKWVDRMKLDDNGKMVARCRLVGRDFKPKGDPGDSATMFAAMPPLEAKRLLFRINAATSGSRGTPMEEKMLFIDVRKAHLNAECDQDNVFVELPSEFGQDKRFARLKRWLYGMRPAAQGWERHYTAKLKSAGFQQGEAAPTVFYHPGTEVSCVVHGDDFTFSGRDRELKDVQSLMESWYQVKVRGTMGSGPRDIREVVILGRTLRYTEEGLEYEADARHRRILMEQFGFTEETNGVVSPTVDQAKIDDNEDVELPAEQKLPFRAGAARLNYLAMDRPDLQYAAKCICKWMAKPTFGAWSKLKRAARYLVGAPSVVWKMGEIALAELELIDAIADSDWAGDKTSRKATSGGILAVGGVAVESWSVTQKSIATSSAEAEYYALTKAIAEGLGLQAVARDMGLKVRVRVCTDSIGAKAIASRKGLGKTRHIEVRFLWTQDLVRDGRVTIYKIDGFTNPADVLTKSLSRADMASKLERVGGSISCRSVAESSVGSLTKGSYRGGVLESRHTLHCYKAKVLEETAKDSDAPTLSLIATGLETRPRESPQAAVCL